MSTSASVCTEAPRGACIPQALNRLTRSSPIPLSSLARRLVKINVTLSDVDLAFGDKEFYKKLAAQVRHGAV